jgi:site-specific recombinase XerD
MPSESLPAATPSVAPPETSISRDPFAALLERDPGREDVAGDPMLPASIERYVISELERERARLRDLRKKGLGAQNTLRAYSADWRVFTAWCAANSVNELPAAPTTVARYVRYLFDRPGRSVPERYMRGGKLVSRMVKEGPAHPKTIARHLLTIRKAHRLLGHDDPTAHRDVKLTVAGLRRERGVSSTPKAAFEGELLDAAVAALDKAAVAQAEALAIRAAANSDDRHLGHAVVAQQLRVARDRAILLLGWSGALRRSEIVALNIADLRFVRQGVEVRLRRSKTNQEGEIEMLGIPHAPEGSPCPVRALRTWLDQAPKSGAVFRSIDRHGVIRDRLADGHINRIVKASAAAIGLRPAEFGAHSLRSGWITTAVRGRVPEERAMQHSRHQSIPIFRGYVRRVSLWDDHPTLQIFEKKPRA